MVPLNMIYLHLLQHSLFEHLFNLYYRYRLLRILDVSEFESSRCVRIFGIWY